MTHKMKLNEAPFIRMKNGTKTVEFRLYDEKRKLVQIGDYIEFSKMPDLEEKLLVRVTNLYRAKTFNELFKMLYGDSEEIERKTAAMHEIYSESDENKYGVLGIEIKIVEN